MSPKRAITVAPALSPDGPSLVMSWTPPVRSADINGSRDGAGYGPPTSSSTITRSHGCGSRGIFPRTGCTTSSAIWLAQPLSSRAGRWVSRDSAAHLAQRRRRSIDWWMRFASSRFSSMALATARSDSTTFPGYKRQSQPASSARTTASDSPPPRTPSRIGLFPP